MARTSTPSVSIIIVNYNGRHLLHECLSSVSALKYPPTKLEVIVVDNNSRDDSISYVRKYYPQVKLVQLTENKGFTGGNQAGLDVATGEMIVLLNNDTKVDPLWLQHLVTAAKPTRVGIVSSKLLFATPFLELTINSDTVPRSDIEDSINFAPVGVLIENIVCKTNKLSDLVWYKSGFYPQTGGPITIRWSKGAASVLVPFVHPQQEEYCLTLHGLPSERSLHTNVTLHLGKTKLMSESIASNTAKQYSFTISRQQAQSQLIWLVQNAGNIVFHNGYSRDRGSLVRMEDDFQMREFYEEDNPYFHQSKPLLAACGAGCLIKRSVIDEIGFFDQYYFMYYDDLDLSLRAWRMGWDIVYEPTAIIYHKHRASTGRTESSFFLSMVERNHLAFTLVHFPWYTFVIELAQFGLRTMVTIVKTILFSFRDNLERFKIWRTRTEGRLRALTYLIKHLPQLCQTRHHWSRRQRRSYHQMESFLY